MTTRKPRPGEVDGVHYWFVDDATFDATIDNGGFLEWAVVHSGSRYGTPAQPVRKALSEGRDTLLEIDLQGARQVRQAIPDALLRLPGATDVGGAGTASGGPGHRGRERARPTAATPRVEELAAEPEFDATLVNAEVHRTAAELVALMESPR